jgi:hypothetical protein
MMSKVYRDNYEFYLKHHPDGPYWKMVQRILSTRGQPWDVKLAAGDPTTLKQVSKITLREITTQHWNYLTLKGIVLAISSYFGENVTRPSAAAKKMLKHIIDEQMKLVMSKWPQESAHVSSALRTVSAARPQHLRGRPF